MFTFLNTLKTALEERLSDLEYELSREQGYLWEYQSGLSNDGPSIQAFFEQAKKRRDQTRKALRLVGLLTFG